MEMKDYHWELTTKARESLVQIERLRVAVNSLETPTRQIEILRHKSLLKSAVYSARIEGFPDTLSSPQLESQNLLRAYNWLYKDKSAAKINIKLIRKLHEMTLAKISDYAGRWRSEPWAVFNEAGVAVHVAPLHTLIPELMEEYVRFINKLSEHPVVKAAIAQFVLEKIHPFADGNGRVGRLISTAVLIQGDYDLKGLAPLEEFIDNNRSGYYAVLEPSHNISLFVEFFLDALVKQISTTLEQLENPQQNSQTAVLTPRRQEIINIIHDHPYCSFDMLRRRFANVNPKTLHYDLGQMIKSGLIKKSGSTRGATYVNSSTSKYNGDV